MQQRVAEARYFAYKETRDHPMVPAETKERAQRSVEAVLDTITDADDFFTIRRRLSRAAEVDADGGASAVDKHFVRNFGYRLQSGLNAIFQPDQWDADAVHVVRLERGGALVAIENREERLTVLLDGVPHFVDNNSPTCLVDQDGNKVATVARITKMTDG